MSLYKKENFSYCDILLPVYNKIETTKLTIDSIVRNTEYPYKFTLIVDDYKFQSLGYSLLELPYKVKNLEYLLVNRERVGIFNCYNQALRITRGNHIAFIMDDFIFPKGWLTKCVQATNKIKTLGMAGCYNEPRRMHERRNRKYTGAVIDVNGVRLDKDGIIAPPGVMKRSTVVKVGLWHDGHDRFGYKDYLTRTKQKGFFNAFIEGTQTVHFHAVCKECRGPIEVKINSCPKCGWEYGGYKRKRDGEIQDAQGPEKFDNDIPNFTYGDRL